MSDTLPPLPPPDGMCELPLASGKWFDAYCARTVKGFLDHIKVHSPDKPLSCGAKVWIETQADVEVS